MNRSRKLQLFAASVFASTMLALLLYAGLSDYVKAQEQPPQLPSELKSRIIEEGQYLVLVSVYDRWEDNLSELQVIDGFVGHGYKLCGDYGASGTYNTSRLVFQKPGVNPDVC